MRKNELLCAGVLRGAPQRERESAASKLKRHTRTDRADSTSAAATVVITLNGHKLNLTGPVLCGVLAHYGTTFCHTHSLTHSLTLPFITLNRCPFHHIVKGRV